MNSVDNRLVKKIRKSSQGQSILHSQSGEFFKLTIFFHLFFYEIKEYCNFYYISFD